MFSRFVVQLIRSNSHHLRLNFSSKTYRRCWPWTMTFIVISAGVPVSYIFYRNLLQHHLWINKSFVENTESVSQSELDRLRLHTQNLLNIELYSSNFIIPIRLLFRTFQLIIIFTPILIFYFIQHKFAPQFYRTWCFTLRRSFEYCGPCFIKLGQWMATRPDLFSDEFRSIFNELHSNAPTHSENETRKLLHQNNINIDLLSLNLPFKPIASGAIAQIYRCKINNQDMIMKIRHPGVQDKIHCDLKILNIMTCLLTKILPKQTFQWLNIEDNILSFTKSMLLQSNLIIEMKNLQIFERNFEKYKSNIRFPHVELSLPSTRDILFETYENGQLLNEFMETCTDTNVKRKLAYLGVNAYLKMLFVDNFVSMMHRRLSFSLDQQFNIDQL